MQEYFVFDLCIWRSPRAGRIPREKCWWRSCKYYHLPRMKDLTLQVTWGSFIVFLRNEINGTTSQSNAYENYGFV